VIKPMRRRSFIVSTLTGAALFAALLSAPAARADRPALGTVVPAGTRLVVGDQNENLQAMITASGARSRLAGKLQFANFRGGPEIFEAFRAGALDVAMVGSTPPIHAHAAGEPLPIVAALAGNAPAYRLALRPGLTISTLQELRGRKIAWAEGTARQPFILSALKKAGLTTRDVTLVSLKVADFPTAIRTGQVDVAPLNEPHLSRYLKDYAGEKASAVPESEYRGLPRSVLYLYASRKALDDPARAAAIRELVAAWMEAVQWTRTNPNEWVRAYYVKKQGLGEADGQAILKSDGELGFPLLRDIVADQQELIDLIYKAGQLPRRLDAKEEFDLRFDTLLAQRNAGKEGAR
jgi:sulfonate transport system substrate-binding protein